MGYEDNPRKVYGRVDVIYSDSQMSSEITPETNSRGVISHPDEVVKGYLSPTVRACTMDGNADMSGGFQMMDNACVVGWWSLALCDENGNFANPKPYLELNFVRRPIITWNILGDSNLNQYPVDFTVDYYDDERLLKTDGITGNAGLEVKLTPMVEDVTRIRLTVIKWNTPNACVKILKFYDRLFERYEGDAVQMFEVNEEMGSADVNYNINSDTMTVSLYNAERKFDKGYLRSLMILDRKLIPYIGVEENGEVKYTQLGTYYSDEWQISQDSQWVKCVAVDKLIRLQTRTYVGFPLTENVSLKEIAEDLFRQLGYTSEQYVISDSLADVVIPNAYLPKTSYWDALQEIANAALCRVFVDRQDRIVITDEDSEIAPPFVKIDAGNMFKATSNITLTEFANVVEVEYSEVSFSDELIDAAQTEIVFGPNKSVKINLDYTNEIANAWIESDNANVQLTGFRSGVDAGEFHATNKTSTLQTAVIKVTGNALVINAVAVTQRDEGSIRNFGTTEYNHPASELVQSYDQASYIASRLIRKLHAGEGVVTTVWRGNPELELGDEYEYTDRFGDSKRLVCEFNKYSFDGGLKQETRGRKKISGGNDG